MEGEDLKKDYFGLYDPTSPGHMGYNWRQAFWHEGENVIYGVHGNSGYLFRFDPAAPRVEVLERPDFAAVEEIRDVWTSSAMVTWGSGSGTTANTIHYLTGGPIYIDGKRVKGKDSTAAGEAKGAEYLHLITYDIKAGAYRDHGPVFYEDGNWPSWVNSIAIGRDGSVYTLARIAENGRTRGDLVRIPSPLPERQAGVPGR